MGEQQPWPWMEHEPCRCACATTSTAKGACCRRFGTESTGTEEGKGFPGAFDKQQLLAAIDVHRVDTVGVGAGVDTQLGSHNCASHEYGAWLRV
jgi:hypothetical protein